MTICTITPRKVFNSFVQPAVEARRTGDKSPLSGAVADTRKILGNNCYGYQIMRDQNI